jgi:hypothetical protein
MLSEEMPFTPPEAARQISFSDSLLRRYALIYESIGGHIPTDNRGGRLYPPVILKTFADVREHVKAGEKVKDAMLTVTAGEQMDLPTETGLQAGANDALALLRQLVEENKRLNERVAALEDKLDKALPTPPESSQAEYIVRLEQLHAEANKRAQYAMDELKRRDMAPAPRRSWWPWGRT